ncbi:hypothetical protein PUV54_08335 [Hyphococcus flavus]|uniref:Lipoprotein n=1 Tax=Hyphococcus flavus TaxID=1866326 RepID=A0AAE9ZDR3_9PROT|nr:hypothetical protein [Hyphococcus flavus]WDI33203.1 hypothetical protein PUV54_08335 [Hyphococcus flavus]
MRELVLVLGGAFLLGACASTGTTSTTAATQTSEEAQVEQVAANEADAQQEVDDSRVICKRTQVTGSRFRKNICRTWGEWKAIEDSSRSATEEAQRRSQMPPQGN